jgi:hypothetical protein
MSATAALSAAAVGSVVAGNQGDFAALTATLAITAGARAVIFGVVMGGDGRNGEPNQRTIHIDPAQRRRLLSGRRDSNPRPSPWQGG